MPMRYPLKDLSVDSFLQKDHKSSLKRPLSPSATLLSPNKRRILPEGSCFSPETKRRTQSLRPLFEEISESPKSASRKLEFAPLNPPIARPAERDTSFRPETPVPDAPSVFELAPSPEITSPASKQLGNEPLTPRVRAPVILIPRELPSVSDRQSIHWPGFDVHLDTHVAIPTSASVAQRRNEAELSDVHEAKENTKPKRRILKTPALPGNSPKPPEFIRPDISASDVGPLVTRSMIFPSPVKQALTPGQKEERRKNKLYMLNEHEGDHDVEEQL